MPGGLETELPGGALVEQKAAQYPLCHNIHALYPNPFCIERPRSEAAPHVRIIDNGDALREHLLVQHVLEKARAPRHRRARDRPRQVTDEAPRYAPIVDDCNPLRADLARMKPPYRALAGI